MPYRAGVRVQRTGALLLVGFQGPTENKVLIVHKNEDPFLDIILIENISFENRRFYTETLNRFSFN